MEFNWKTSDGLTIFAHEWPAKAPKAVIALVHGFGEHCMRYDAMARYYHEKGYAMIGYDRRGHGRSEGPLGHTPDYQLFLEEIDDLINACKDRYPDAPIVLYGHSMGGNLVLNYQLNRPDLKLRASVVTGPWIRLTKEPPAILKFIVRVIRKIAPTFSQENKLGKYVSRVQEEVDKYMNDPLVHGKMSVNLAYEMFVWGDKLLNYQGPIKYPTLIMHAGDDQLTDPEATKKFVQNVTGPVSLKVWEGLYHEIHNESIREQVYDYAINWLDEQIIK